MDKIILHLTNGSALLNYRKPYYIVEENGMVSTFHEDWYSIRLGKPSRGFMRIL
jgi:hypothetical protein